MSDFGFPSSPYPYRTPGPQPGSGPAALIGPNATKSLQEIALLLGPGATTGLHAQPGLSTPGLHAPLLDCAPEDMIAFIGAIIAKTQDGQMRTIRNGIDVSHRKLEERHTAAMAALDEIMKKTREADRNSGAGGFFNTLKRIGGPLAAVIGVIVAAAAIVATGGAATPVMVAFLTLAFLSSSMALAGQIAKEAGYDQPLDVSHWLAKGFTTMLTDEFGVSEEDALHGGKLMSGAMAPLALLDPKIMGNLAGGIAGFAGADETDLAIVEATFTVVATIAVMALGMNTSASRAGKVADAVEEASKAAKGVDAAADGAAAGAGNAGKVARLKDLQKNAQAVASYGRMVQAGTALSNGTAAIGSGAIDVMKAEDQRDIALAQGEKQKVQATIMKIQRQLDEEREALKKVMDEMSNVTVVMTDVLANAASTRSQIASASPRQAI